MELDFTGKTVVVTGAASGIGRAIAVGFARRGAKVVASDLQEEKLRGLKEDPELAQLDIVTHACNVSVAEDVAALFAADALRDGFDALVHCAGVTFFKTVTDTTAEEYRKLIETNLSGTFYCMQQAAAKMKRHQSKGSIIVISSINAITPLFKQAVYSSTKAAIDSLVQSLAIELAPHGIRVNSIAPGGVNTALVHTDPEKRDKRLPAEGIPSGYSASPDDMVGTALFLASPLSEYVVGTRVVVDGGLIIRR